MVKIYEIGGCVRDRFMGLKPDDIDFSVEASSFEEMETWMVENRFHIWQSRPQYLTSRAKFPLDHPKYAGLNADFVLCRVDGAYSDGRRPDDVQVGNLYDDQARRDFTVNSIAVDIDTDEIIDPFHGQDDLQTMCLRCVGTPRERFTEDGLRVIRALRFMITKGFHFNGDLWDALESDWVVPLVRKVVTDRRRQELEKCFKHDVVETLKVLAWFPHIQDVLFDGGLWLKPTVEER